jgi:hypothetical protein
MKSRAKRGRVYKSKTEGRVAKKLRNLRQDFKYESLELPYVVNKTYTPDFVILPDGPIIEVKGVLLKADRSKMKHVREQYPDLDIRFIFMHEPGRQSTAHKKCPGIKMTHAEWAEANGFLWYDEQDFKSKDLK